MALSRRLKKVEGDLDPHALLIRWLADAHAFGSTEAYAAWLIEQPDPKDPFARLLDRIEERVRAMHGKRSTDVRREITAAHREALFGANVTFRLNVEAEERLVTFGLIQTTLMFWLRELTLRDALAEHGVVEAWLGAAEGLDRSWGHWQGTAATLLAGLYETAQAREALQARYLSGHDSLFPATADGWRDLVERSEGLYGMATTLRDGDPFAPLESFRETAASGFIAIAERVVRMASYQTHAAMGEHERADAALQHLMTA